MHTSQYMEGKRKFSFSPSEAARLMKFGEKAENKQLTYYAQILFVDQ
jgi:hypothetical protein